MKYNKKEFARHLRKYQTDCEKVMWKLLRNRRFENHKFRRQHVIEGFIVDFCCYKLKYIVEIDGWIHEKQKEYDKAREAILKSKGYSIIRFKNEEVVNNLDGVMRRLKLALTHFPSPRGRVKQSRKLLLS